MSAEADLAMAARLAAAEKLAEAVRKLVFPAPPDDLSLRVGVSMELSHAEAALSALAEYEETKQA